MSYDNIITVDITQKKMSSERKFYNTVVLRYIASVSEKGL